MYQLLIVKVILKPFRQFQGNISYFTPDHKLQLNFECETEKLSKSGTASDYLIIKAKEKENSKLHEKFTILKLP